jgi:pimeloyl-ACP methyl ester carboxylesterase
MVAENLAATVPNRVLSLTLGGFPPGLDLDQRRALFPPDKAPASWDEMFRGWPEPLIDLYKANTDLAAVQAIWVSLSEQPTTIADLQSSAHPTMAYIGAEDPLLELTRRQCAALPCRLEIVPGDHMAGFAQADNVLPLAISHIEASAPPTT